VIDAEPEPVARPDSEKDHPETASPSRATVWGVVLASLAMALLFPAADAAAWMAFPKPHRVVSNDSVVEMLPLLGGAAILVVWVFVFWSLIGSFLNVVVYRLPLGESVVLGGSRCPRCDRPIKWHDNLPVVGWLVLNGRCRSCQLPIAARYPVVEAICAGLGTALYFRELLSGGANLPQRAPDFLHGGMLSLFPNPSPDLIGLSLYHCGTLCVLLAWGLIAWDRRPLPGRHVLAVLLVATILPIMFPHLHPLTLDSDSAGGHAANDWLFQGLAVSAAGGCAGFCCGQFLHLLLNRLLRGDAAGRSGLPLLPTCSMGVGLALVGIVFGWQGMLGTVILLLVACLLQILIWSAVMAWPSMPLELLLVPATFIHLCAWRQLVTSLAPWWPGTPTPACLVLPSALMLLVSLALLAIAPTVCQSPPPTDTDTKHHGDEPASVC